jgi:OmpA-OmpF porin, OOP family
MRTTKLLATLALMLPAMAHAGTWYAGLDVGSGQSDAKINEYFTLGGATARDSDTSTVFRVRGGYQFGRFFALEVAYVDFGEVEYQFDPDDCPWGSPGPCPFSARSSINGFVGTLRGIWPIGDHWFFDARLGYGSMKTDTHVIGPTDISESRSNGTAHYGLASGYRFTDHWEVVLDFSEYAQDDMSRLGGDSGTYNLGESSVTSVGISYRW